MGASACLLLENRVNDIVDPATRSRMMAGIRSGDTKPEKLLRKALHSLGFRYRLHVPSLLGRPDLVFPKYHAVLFVHGCFWHGHDCPLFRMPGTRKDFWENKLRRNRERDIEVRKILLATGWRLGIVWECTLKGKKKIGLEKTVSRIVEWLESDRPEFETGCAA